MTSPEDGQSVMGELPEATASKLPRWRGFNLHGLYTVDKELHFQESDFELMREWGFNFARLPMDYRIWSEKEDPSKLLEERLEAIDQALEWGRHYAIHVNLNFHRAPGHCVNWPPEPFNLWKEEEPLALSAQHWAMFARRYRGVPNRLLSFNLLNEPPWELDEPAYARVIRRLTGAIRAEDPDRLIIVDGLRWGYDAVKSLVDLGVAQSLHAYEPIQLSHYKAEWFGTYMGADKWPEPTWPLTIDGVFWDRERLSQRVRDWQAIETQGVGIHIGEFGAYCREPHSVVLAWMKDWMELIQEAGWGWAIWDFRGSYGPLNSRRKDVAYEDFRDMKLDRKMLDLIRAF